MGRVFLKYLDGLQVYVCTNCKCHLSTSDDIISKQFHGRQGKAYLFDRAVNVVPGPPEDRSLMTGMHVVRDVYCTNCHTILGWKYDDAHETSQKYKIGKLVIEKARLRKEAGLTALQEREDEEQSQNEEADEEQEYIEEEEEEEEEELAEEEIEDYDSYDEVV